MVRRGDLFSRCFSEQNLFEAYLDARKGKRAKRACFEFDRSAATNLSRLRSEILDGGYRPAPYYSFQVYEPKPRIIHAPAFRDVIAQHAIYRTIYPIFDASFIQQSFACRKGLGTHACSEYTQNALRKYDGELYTLKLDVKKFFYRIDRDVLRSLVERKIKDGRLVDLMMLYADYGEPVGIPIGNLLSQVYALIYLNPVDHHIKRALKVKHYARYVDDMLLIGLTRDECILHRDSVEMFLRDNLRLEYSKTSIQKIKKGVNFVGYRTWRGKKFVRKHSLYSYSKALKSGNIDAVVSHLGHAAKTQSLNYMLTKAKEIDHELYCKLPKSYRGRHNIQTARA